MKFQMPAGLRLWKMHNKSRKFGFNHLKIIFQKKINSPHLKDLEPLYGQKYEVISTKRHISQDLPLQKGVAVYHLAKLCLLQFYFQFIDKYIDRSDSELLRDGY
jgi:hypothetical protein